MSSHSIEHTAHLPKPHDQPTADRRPDSIDRFFPRARREIGRGTLIGGFLAKAEDHLRAEGITLAFGTLEQLVEVNKANPRSWKPIVPIYQPWGEEADRGTVTLLARDASGRVVGTMAARTFDWTGSNFQVEATSMRLFYARPELRANPAEACAVTAPSAATLTGRVAICGAAWWDPSVRGGDLSQVCGRALRAYTLAHLKTDFFIGMMAQQILSKGVAAQWGYRHAEQAVEFQNFAIGAFQGSLIWMTADELLEDLQSYWDVPGRLTVHHRVARRA
jgi:hypothetical protein